MTMRMAALAATTMLIAAAAPAAAATTITFTPVLGVPTGVFGNLNPGGSATDHYVFTLPSAGTVNGTVGSIGLRLFGTNLDFSAVTLNGNPFTVQSTGIVELRTIMLSVLAGPQTLDVAYTNAQRFSTYGGVLTFSAAVGAVPEPASWGLMILGFGVIGGAMRYRRRATIVRFA